MQHARRHLVSAELVERSDDRFQRALHVGLDHQRKFLAAGSLGLRHHLLERAAHAGGAGSRLLALLAAAVIGDFAGAAFVLHHRQAITGIGRAGEAEHFDRRRRAGALDRLAGVGHQRAHTAPFGAGNNPIISRSLSILVFLVAETSTSTTSPPMDSTWISCCSRSVRTRSGLASGLSILLMATMIGTFAALA